MTVAIRLASCCRVSGTPVIRGYFSKTRLYTSDMATYSQRFRTGTPDDAPIALQENVRVLPVSSRSMWLFSGSSKTTYESARPAEFQIYRGFPYIARKRFPGGSSSKRRHTWHLSRF